MIALARAELRLSWRNRLLTTLALGLPLATSVWLAFGVQAQDASDWGTIAALALLFMLLTTVYTMATTTVAARRQQLVLKRLRCGETSDARILGGLLAPIVVIAAAQATVLLVSAVAAGAPVPARPLLLVPPLALGAVLCAAAALATTRWTPSAELAQLTTAPFMLAAMAGASLGLAGDHPSRLALLAPGGAFAGLVREAWSGAGGVALCRRSAR